MKYFEAEDVTPFELEVQIAVENASMEKKVLSQVLKELNPQTKQYKKAMEALDKLQEKEWRMITKEIQNQNHTVLSEIAAKLPGFQAKIEQLTKTISLQSQKMAEKKPSQPISPRRPGE